MWQMDVPVPMNATEAMRGCHIYMMSDDSSQKRCVAAKSFILIDALLLLIVEIQTNTTIGCRPGNFLQELKWQ
jgi:hypothetical protein